MAGPVVITISLDPQWELAVEALIPHLEEALAEGLITEDDVAEVLLKTAILPWLRVEAG